MSSAPKGKAWASDEDWQKHRDIITNLWWVEDKPLKDVQTIMADEYDFHASDKMYKGRLKGWGLLKNLKSKDANQIMGLAKSGVATGPLVIRGRPMGSKKWQKRLNRVVTPGESASSPVLIRKNSAVYHLPLPEHLAAPDTLRLTETGLQAIRDFTALKFTTQAWDLSGLPYDFDNDKTDGWSNGTVLATQNLIKDRNSATNFSILNKCFEEYAAVVDQATPALIPCTLNNVIRLIPVGPAVADELLGYAARLITIKYGGDHPLSRFMAQMHILGAVQVPLVARAILGAYFDIIVENSHPANRWRTAMYPTYARIMQQFWGALPADAVAKIYDDTIRKIEASLALLDMESADSLLYDQTNRHLYEVKGYYVVWLVDQKRFPEADQVAEEMGTWLRAGAAMEYKEQWEQYLRIKALILVGLERPEEATPFFVQVYESRRDRLGLKNHRTTRSISDLEEHYRSLNNVEAAEKLHTEFEASYEDEA
ncbi:hypothetical protein TruAng_006158 [Truncatella angustata]|nr:hypothetical protein TruAng_006158 [Truncatella angustata]